MSIPISIIFQILPPMTYFPPKLVYLIAILEIGMKSIKMIILLLFIWTPRYCEYDLHSAPTSEHFVRSGPNGFDVNF